MPKNKPLTEQHKKNISNALMGNTWSKGKNLNNKNALGKTVGDKNGNWKGGKPDKEKLAGRLKPSNCEVCYKITNLDFDHCHTTGEFRGWICRRCNLVLGMVKDNPVLLRNLSVYLDIRNKETRPVTVFGSLLENNYVVQLNNSPTENTTA